MEEVVEHTKQFDTVLRSLTYSRDDTPPVSAYDEPEPRIRTGPSKPLPACQEFADQILDSQIGDRTELAATPRRSNEF